MTDEMLRRLSHHVDAHAAQAVAFLQALVRVPSDNPPGDCAPHAAAAKRLLEGLGFTVEAHPVPEETVRAHGMVSVTNLIVRHRFGDGPTVALNAHGDVVPPGSGWTREPFDGEIHDGWLYGRGAAVSKSDFATYAFALKALIESRLTLSGTVELHLTYDEEIGGVIGPARILAEGLSRPTHAICAAFAYDVVTAHNGCLHLEVIVRGKSAHAAWAHTGHDALQATVPLLQALYRYRDSLTGIRSTYPGLVHPSLVVGLISGGINTNVVPDQVRLRLDRRILPDEDAAGVEAALRQLIEANVTGEGIGVEVRRVLLARPFLPVGDADGFADMLCHHATRILGVPVGKVAVPLYTDARHYAEAGIPTIMYGAGPKNPLDANGHRADERLPVETLRQATEVVAATLAELLGAAA